MNILIELISKNEDWLLLETIQHAKNHGYTRYTSTLVEAWRISIASLSEAMFNILNSNEDILSPSVDDQYSQTTLDRFSIEEVHKHRARGITLGMFLGLVKYYRRSYCELVRQQSYKREKERKYLIFLESFFDRFEVGYSVEWNMLTNSQAADELRSENRVLTNEKNKYLTIFESLYDPVILLDQDNKIENINQAAAELFQTLNLPTQRYYDRHPADQVFPWLANDILVFSKNDDPEMIVMKTLQTQKGLSHFQVKMKQMLDVSEKYRGTVLILNNLTERIKKEEAIILNRAIQKWVNTLVDISYRISSGMDIDEILLIIMESIYELINPEVAALGMWDEAGKKFRVQYLVTASGSEKIDRVFVPDKTMARSVLTELKFPIPYEHIELVSPTLLKQNGQVTGCLWVGQRKKKNFTASDRIVCESLVQQMAIAIEHALITDQQQLSAIVEERARLAREMHDGLSQILGFLSLEMQSLELLIEQGMIDETLVELNKAKERIRDAQAEVRENILNLRTALANDEKVIPFLQEYIDEFQEQTGIKTFVDVSGAQEIGLTPICEVQLVRIVQEALTNIRIHAQATHLWVEFQEKENSLCVDIRDDGTGFIETELKKHFGLKSMRERTESMDGEIIIESQPGVGTHISLCLPFSEQVSVSRQERIYDC